ncbi:MAG: OmpH family outer membrane protein [Thermoguttaceae bacterium]
MRKSHLVVALAASVVWSGLAGRPAAAQQQPPQPVMRMPGGVNVALVDVAYIFKKHARFKAQREEWRADFMRTQEEFKARSEGMKKQAEHLKDFRPGTPDYKALEEELVDQQAKLQGQTTLKQKEFQQREAKIFYNVYQEILQEVKYYCQANSVGLVLNFNGDAMNSENPEDVGRGVMRPVVFYDPALDITPIILKRLSPEGPAVPAANSNSRPGVYVPR